MKKVVVKILQGSVVTQTKLGGLATYLRVVNFLQCIHAKNYESRLAVEKVIAKIIRLTFFGPPCIVKSLPVYHTLYAVRSAITTIAELLVDLRPRRYSKTAKLRIS